MSDEPLSESEKNIFEHPVEPNEPMEEAFPENVQLGQGLPAIGVGVGLYDMAGTAWVALGFDLSIAEMRIPMPIEMAEMLHRLLGDGIRMAKLKNVGIVIPDSNSQN